MLSGGVFSKTEMSEVLTEVVRMDPAFDKEEFIKLCRFDIIPNVLEVTEYFSVTVNDVDRVINVSSDNADLVSADCCVCVVTGNDER